jgi:SAM-dependent methyltransferase
MQGADFPSPEYALPHLLERDVRATLKEPERPYPEVLIIGAGSGNDVSRALEWGVGHIDAVEIDPVIYRLGAADHPLRPYQNTDRVTVHLNDGRNFLRTAPEKKYDLIIYALVDSLVLHSGYSSIRLESYLFTKEAFQDIKRCLKDDGLFVTYNYFRQGWVVMRVANTLNSVFGPDNAVVFTFPDRIETIEPGHPFEFGVVFAGPGTERMKKAFYPEGQPLREYWLKYDIPSKSTPNGFPTASEEDRASWRKLTRPEKEEVWGKGKGWRYFAPANFAPSEEHLENSTDNWPFLYVREPMVPARPSLSGMAVMGALGLVLILLFAFFGRPKSANDTTMSTGNGGAAKKGWPFDLRMFFLGAGFMLIETKAVVHMALLFGSTWIVNSVVFFAVLVMILLANLFVLRVKPEHLWPYYVGLFITLALNAFIPLSFFLDFPRWEQIIASCLLVFAPIAFAGVIFATAFRKTANPDLAFGANIAGAMLGGLAENTSMLLGFQWLVLVAIGFYALSAVGAALGWINTTKAETV